MANKIDKDKQKKIEEINKKYSTIMDKMEDVYKSTYKSRMTNAKELKNVTSDIYDTVDQVLSTNSNISGIPSASKMYSRLFNKNGSGESMSGDDMNGIMDLFNDKQILNSVNIDPECNRYIKSMDAQYDLICKYMPKLEEALDIKKDNVLSSDSFVKEFLNVSKVNSIDHELFVSRDKELKDKHDLDNLIEAIYKKVSKYGEYFLYCVPYKRALEQLLRNKNSSPQNYVGNISSKSYFETTSVICENGSFLESSDDYNNIKDLKMDEKLSITLNFDNSGLLSETVLAYQSAEKAKENLSNKFRSVHESFIEESAGNKSVKLDKIMSDELEYDDAFKSSSDGTINVVANDDIKINDIPGCILKEIDRDKIQPIYAEKTCLGYYMITCRNNADTANMLDNQSPTSNSFSSVSKSIVADDNDKVIRYISGKVSSAINANFINNNIDLKDDIYAMLKYNDEFNINSANEISVSFLPPEDVFHITFEMDQKTHRGISDLSKALIPATFWCLLDLSTTMGIVTRSQDKRIYYVKQHIEKNTSKTLMNVVNQVKKGNMGIRQIDSMNNVLNVIGRYNDHVIPTNSAGDPPITFEVMQGQTIDTPTELMAKWEESAINSTDVPLELVNSVMNIDYAIRYTMQNSKFLRKVFKRQFVCEKVFSKIYTRIYNYEYNETETQIKVTLPAPMFLSMSNGSQLINNTREWCEGIANMEYTEDSDEKKEFIRLLMRHTLPSYIDLPLIENTKSKAKINVAVNKKSEEDN